MKITLATSSKFKSDILKKSGIKHTCLNTDAEELSCKKNIFEYTMEISAIKARACANMVSEGIVIGLDTVVDINGLIIEKPKTIEEGKNNLRMASNNVTKVITGITLINLDTEEVETTTQTTSIYMKKITEEELDYYISNESDILNVSGFVFENIASCFIDRIEGSYYNILGGPVEKIYEILKKQNVKLSELD